MTTGEIVSHLSLVFEARDRAAVGLYCECDEPQQSGTICAECERCIRSIEIEQVRRIVEAHGFQPDLRHPEMCAVCSNWKDHRRHNGHSDVGYLRDGTEVTPDA